ncbi:MAG: hypothetical protein IKP90_07535 [Fibrobacter sp.]|nr:hypothetical protein [Fibrobacter sp.]
MRIVLFFSFLLVLAACDGGGASGPVVSSSSVEESSETISSVAESSSSVLPSSSEEVSSSQTTPVSSSSSAITSSSEQNSSAEVFYVSYGSMTDERDGQVYKTVTIEGEIVDYWINSPFAFPVKIPKITWMIENLNYPYLQPTAELDSSSLCFENDSANCARYGRLYLWSAAVDSAALFSEDGKGCGYYATEEDALICFAEKDKSARGVCPEGWRLPTYEEDFQFAEWRGRGFTQVYDEEETETIGYYNSVEGEFRYEGSDIFWLSTETKVGLAYSDFYDPSSLAYSEGNGTLYDAIRANDKRNACPVRCVKDSSD